MNVRFAPSPTGTLHIGGVRTALYNYILAKQNKGNFILRIDDTDQDRLDQTATKYIYDSLNWFGLIPDQGPVYGGDKIYIQSHKSDVYSKIAHDLVDMGFAYFAYDTPDDLQTMRDSGHQYDKHVRHLMKNKFNPDFVPENSDYVIRILMPDKKINFTDAIIGDCSYQLSDMDDKVLFRRNGATYHLASVVDDFDMRITHIYRGNDWFTSTPLHLYLWSLIGDYTPIFGHLPLILAPDGTKLSKRNSVSYGIPVIPLPSNNQLNFKDMGFLPQAILNYLATLGWSHPNNIDIFSIDDLVMSFDINNLHRSAAKFDINKAKWVNSQWIQKSSVSELMNHLKPFLSNYVLNIEPTILNQALDIVKKRCTMLTDFNDQLTSIFTTPIDYDFKIQDSGWNKAYWDLFFDIGFQLNQNKQIDISTIKILANKYNVSWKDALTFFRIMLIGKSNGIGVFEIINIIGNVDATSRIVKFIGNFGTKR